MKKWFNSPTLIFVTMHLTCMLFLTGLMSCAPDHFTPVEKKIYTSFKTLEAANTFRDTGLKVVADFWKQGLIEVETKNKIIFIGDDLQRSINSAGKALRIYHDSSGVTGSDDLATKIVLYQQIYGQFVDLVMPYILKQGGD